MGKILYKLFISAATMCCFSFYAAAQTGYNEAQIAAQLSFPVGDLAQIAKRGHGFSAKGLWGIGKANQQLTTEVGYSYFNIKDTWLTEDVGAYYGGFVLYGGYRYRFNNIFIEPQAGVAFYKIDAFSSVNVQGIQESDRYFDWAIGAGYNLGHIDVGLRYQNASVKNSNDISFIGLRLGYKFYISKKAKELNN